MLEKRSNGIWASDHVAGPRGDQAGRHGPGKSPLSLSACERSEV